MQFVGYHTAPGDGPAELVLASGGDVERVALDPGAELAYALGDRHCAGVVRDGRHESCSAPTAPHCLEHTSTWPCARCTGSCAMPLDSCREQHAVYLAAFAPDVVKVGVTRSWRVETRLREQGADRAAHIRTVENGKVARQVEADIATEFTDRVRVPAKISGLGEHVDDEVWRDARSGFDPVETYDFDYGLDLDRRPVAETMATGTVVGTKGRVLVLERGATTYAADLRDLVGYDVTRGATGRDRQSSLGAF